MTDQYENQRAVDAKPVAGTNGTNSRLFQAVALAGVVAITVVITLWVSRDTEQVGVEILIPPPAPVTFQVSGEVIRPGVYSLEGEPRINDAIDIAGGLTPDADTNRINLALRVRDGVKVVIPTLLDANEALSNTSIEGNRGGSSPFEVPDASFTTGKTVGEVDLNTATKEQLVALPGIGAVRASSIIEWRTNNLINSVDDLLAISGIGAATIESIRDYVIQP